VTGLNRCDGFLARTTIYEMILHGALSLYGLREQALRGVEQTDASGQLRRPEDNPAIGLVIPEDLPLPRVI
jgi:hypothetical protein